ncbi:MAG: spermidine synthase [Planctomycetota bacterium]
MESSSRSPGSSTIGLRHFTASFPYPDGHSTLRVFVVYALSGFISLAYQVCWFRIVTHWYGSTTLTFALVVCSFICGLGTGALFSKRLGGMLEGRFGVRDLLRVYGALEIMVGLTALLTVPAELLPADLMGSFPYQLHDGIWAQSDAYRSYQVLVGVSCVFIPCFFMGTTFPLLCRAFVAAPNGHRFPSALYAWNTLGAVSGVMACQFLLIPLLGHMPTYWLMAVSNVALGGYFVLSGGAPAVPSASSSERRSLESTLPAPGSDRGSGAFAFVVLAGLSGLVAGSLEGDLFKRLDFILGELGAGSGAMMSFISFWAVLGIFLALAAWLTPAHFAPSFFYPGTGPTNERVWELRANAANTTFVLEYKAPLGRKLYFNSYSMSDTSGWAQTYMRLMAHVPLLAQESPERALLIGFGVGNTASAIAAHQRIQAIDVVDLNRNVFLTAPVFRRTSGSVHEDPRLRLINDDGRGYLRATAEKYDLITSEPPPPLASGVYRLYSREYYEDALAHLTPEGMMTQWLPMYHLPQEAADLMIRTFVSVFPKVMLNQGFSEAGSTDLLLIGGRSAVDIEQVITRTSEEPRVAADLRRLGIRGGEGLRVRVIEEDGPLCRAYERGRVLSDHHNDLEHLYTAPGNRAVYPPSTRPARG